MEKAKRKQSVKNAQNRLTTLLLIILGLSIFFYQFPLIITWEYVFFNLPLQTYALLPLLSLPLGIWFFRRYGFTKLQLILILMCFGLAFALYLRLQPCGAWLYPVYEKNDFITFFRFCRYSPGLF